MLEYRRVRCLQVLRTRHWELATPTTFKWKVSLKLCAAGSQNIPELDENYVVIQRLLGEGLRQCQKCHGEPLSLDNIGRACAPMRIGLGKGVRRKRRPKTQKRRPLVKKRRRSSRTIRVEQGDVAQKPLSHTQFKGSINNDSHCVS